MAAGMAVKIDGLVLGIIGYLKELVYLVPMIEGIPMRNLIFWAFI
jgi:hypothetical protein